MTKTKIYLDNCCYNRPYDDQNQLRIELETKSKLFIQSLIVDGKIDLVISYVLIWENDDNPYEFRKSAIQDFFRYAKESIRETSELLQIAKELSETGIKPIDALHVASAIISECKYFLTTDDRVLKLKDQRIKVINPIDFVRIEEVL